MNVMNEHIPHVTHRVKNKELPGWKTQDTLQQIFVRDKFKGRAKNNILAWTMYKRAWNTAVVLICNAKSKYFKDKILENKTTQYKKSLETAKTNCAI